MIQHTFSLPSSNWILLEENGIKIWSQVFFLEEYKNYRVDLSPTFDQVKQLIKD